MTLEEGKGCHNLITAQKGRENITQSQGSTFRRQSRCLPNTTTAKENEEEDHHLNTNMKTHKAPSQLQRTQDNLDTRLPYPTSIVERTTTSVRNLEENYSSSSSPPEPKSWTTKNLTTTKKVRIPSLWPPPDGGELR